MCCQPMNAKHPFLQERDFFKGHKTKYPHLNLPAFPFHWKFPCRMESDLTVETRTVFQQTCPPSASGHWSAQLGSRTSSETEFPGRWWYWCLGLSIGFACYIQPKIKGKRKCKWNILQADEVWRIHIIQFCIHPTFFFSSWDWENIVLNDTNKYLSHLCQKVSEFSHTSHFTWSFLSWICN